MNHTHIHDSTNDLGLLNDVRTAADSGLRVLAELELDFVGGGDGPLWDNGTPPSP